MIIGNLKCCTGCGEWKPLLSYVKEKPRCRPCLNIQRKEWAEKNPQAILEYRNKSKQSDRKRSHAYRTLPKNRAKVLFHAAKTRAVQSGLNFDLTEEYIFTLLICQNMRCAQTSIEFDFRSNEGKRLLAGPSIDRKNPKLGYTKDNIQIVCWFYNAAKGTHTDNEIWDLFYKTFTNKGLR